MAGILAPWGIPQLWCNPGARNPFSQAVKYGGVNLLLPDNYSAHLETGTVNGNVSFGFPVNVALTERGRIPKDVSVDLGAGGPTVRATTTNGGVRVGRLSAFE